MNNFIKTKGWLESAFIDLDTFVYLRSQNKFYPAVYYLQQSVGKGTKAIIAFLGIEVKHTHFPAKEIIQKEILDNQQEIERLGFTQEHIQLLNEICNNAIKLEDEETKPRYGEELKDMIILPTEIYTEEKSKELFNNGFIFWKTILTFLRTFNISELQGILNNIDEQLKKF